MIYILVNGSISTTGHELQGKTLNNLIANAGVYHIPHWVNVIM